MPTCPAVQLSATSCCNADHLQRLRLRFILHLLLPLLLLLMVVMVVRTPPAAGGTHHQQQQQEAVLPAVLSTCG
jgi:hypothetical protein